MALILAGGTTCAICGATLAQTDELVSTSGGAIEPNDALWKYQDAAMHRSCFLSWPLRDAFRGRINEYYERHLRGMRFMREDGTIESREPRASAAV
jgi:hypothetical protein